MKEYINLLHTNDLHSHFENWPRLSRLLKQPQVPDSSVFKIDLGDFMDREAPLTEWTNGHANVELLNQAKYDLVTIGNNEGITNNKQQLNHLFDKANFKVTLANLQDLLTKKQPIWAEPIHYFKTERGTTLGFIGLTAPMPLTYEPFGWQVLDPVQCLEKWLPVMEQTADIIIVLSHLGLPMDREVAKKFNQIDCILGSHTHHLLPQGELEQGVLLAAAGRYGEYLGKVTFCLEAGQLISKKAVTFPVIDIVEKSEDQKEIEELRNRGKNGLQKETVTELVRPLYKEKELIEQTLLAMLNESHTAIALINSGLFLKTLLEGRVSRYDLHQCLPHPMNLVRVTLKGKDLSVLILKIEKLRSKLKEQQIIGMKFRGKVFGEIWYHGINQVSAKQINVLDEPIDLEKNYQLVTVDHLTFLPYFYVEFNQGKIEILSARFLREVVADWLANRIEE